MGGQVGVVLDESPGRADSLSGDGTIDMTSASTTQVITSRATAFKPSPAAPVEVEAPGTYHRTCGRRLVAPVRDLSTELPALLAVLLVRLGHIERVSYKLVACGPGLRPRRLLHTRRARPATR